MYQSHTSRLTELWSLPKPVQGLNIYNNNNDVLHMHFLSEFTNLYEDGSLEPKYARDCML